MRILKRGKYVPPVYHGVCRTCKTEFEANEDEVQYQQGDPGDYQSAGYYYTRCPVCNSQVLYLKLRTPATGGVGEANNRN